MVQLLTCSRCVPWGDESNFFYIHSFAPPGNLAPTSKALRDVCFPTPVPRTDSTKCSPPGNSPSCCKHGDGDGDGDCDVMWRDADKVAWVVDTNDRPSVVLCSDFQWESSNLWLQWRSAVHLVKKLWWHFDDDEWCLTKIHAFFILPLDCCVVPYKNVYG